MDLGGFNPIDLLILGIFVVSGLLALMRGLVKEVLSIGGWVVGVLGTLHLFPLLQPFGKIYISSEYLANAAVIVATFIAVMIVISLITTFIAKKVSDSRLGPLDRALGFVFGLLRGAILVCIAYLLLAWLAPPDRHPEIVREARALPLVIDGSALLVKLVPADMRPKLPESADSIRKRVEKTVDDAQAAGQALKTLRDAAGESGYKGKDRGLLDQLIDSAGRTN